MAKKTEGTTRWRIVGPGFSHDFPRSMETRNYQSRQQVITRPNHGEQGSPDIPDDETVRHLVSTYAGDENDHQRQMFDDSLRAALTVDEVVWEFPVGDARRHPEL